MTKFEEVKKNIEETFPDLEIEYSYDVKNKWHEASFEQPNGVFIFSINEESKWIDIKRTIENFIHLPEDALPECLICYEKIKTEVGFCEVCAFIYCGKCYLKIYNENRGTFFIEPSEKIAKL